MLMGNIILEGWHFWSSFVGFILTNDNALAFYFWAYFIMKTYLAVSSVRTFLPLFIEKSKVFSYETFQAFTRRTFQGESSLSLPLLSSFLYLNAIQNFKFLLAPRRFRSSFTVNIVNDVAESSRIFLRIRLVIVCDLLRLLSSTWIIHILVDINLWQIFLPGENRLCRAHSSPR